MSIRNELLERQNETLLQDEFGRTSMRVTINSEVSNQLLAGRVLLVQTETEDLAIGQSIELAIQSTVGVVTLLNLDVAAQMSEVTLEVFEGGTGLAGGISPTVINPNRLNIPTPNTSFLEGTPTAPITGTDGSNITPPGGYVLIGTEGPADAQYVSSSVDIGGFLCQPNTWYQLRLTNTSQNADRPIQLSLKIIDPSDPV
ncbi:hypothetical protein [Vibrio phage LP.2]|nr:hypothetical protein [Vibrio phage LP.2]